VVLYKHQSHFVNN